MVSGFLTSQAIIQRAKKMLGQKTVYKLGKGGFNPKSEYAYDPLKRLDCSGYIAWCLGFSRNITDSFYANYNGDGKKGWFETTAAYKDAITGTGILTKIDEPRVGCIAVYPDYTQNDKKHEGHIGIITEVSANSKATKVIHCSSSAYKKYGDAVQENTSSALLNNPKVIFAAYDEAYDFRDVSYENPLSVNSFVFDKLENDPILIPVFEYLKNGKLYYRAWRFQPESIFFFQSHARVCADGAPNAYKKADQGIDYLENAGRPPFKGAPKDKDLNKWQWWALVVNEINFPIEQKHTDLYPGYFISTTAHSNKDYKLNDPRRYVDANNIPYIVLPKKNSGSAELGDFAFIIDKKTGLTCPAIYSEVGPRDSIGELSIKAADILKIPSNPRKGGVSRKDILYIVFPGSGNGKPRSLDEIIANATNLFEDWGGLNKVNGLPDLKVL